MDPCSGFPDAGSCSTAMGCRWLTPGCGAPALPTAGCFPAVDCNAADCAPGLTCQSVVIDPCFNKGCDACGADVSVCLP